MRDRDNKIGQGILLWAGLLAVVAGLALGLSHRTASLAGGKLQCGSAWSPVDNDGLSYLYPAVVKACDKVLWNWGAIGVVVLLLGVILVAMSVMALAVARPPAVGTSDHP